MEESDKTTTLKKAYAEIILNTAKESAARVMVSDIKSARFLHDPSGTEEEAFHLLVRLKQMIDAKTIEADIKSLNRQRQIDVLEAQLQEAEDIITDLRSDVRWVRDKLEKAKAYESREQNVVNKEEEMVSVQTDNPEVVVESLTYNQEVADTCFSVKIDSLPDRSSLHDVKCENDEKHFDGISVHTLKGNDVCETELDVDIRIKKLELSTNGCTQMVHALERKVVERKSSSSAIEEEQEGTTGKDSKENLSSEKVNGHEAGDLGNTGCIVLALRDRSGEVITKPLNSLGIIKTSKLRKLRGRKKRKCGKRKATSVRSQSQLIKPCQSQSNVPCYKTSTSDGEDSMESQRERSKNMHSTDHLVEPCQESNLVSINVEDAEDKVDIPENETKTKPLRHLNSGLTSIKSNVDPTSGSINVTLVSAKAANRATDKDLTSRKEDVLVRCEGEEDGVVPSTKMASNFVNLHSDSKVTAVVSDQISESPRANVNRLLKYTFQRQRSNIIDDSNNPPGKRDVKEKENNASK